MPPERRSPERKEAPQPPEWSRLLEEALTMPGQLSSVYNRFYRYSLGNQTLLWMQGVTEPVATYKRWAEMGRQVQRGSKAKAILRPVTIKLHDQLDEHGQPKQLTKFKLVNCLFTASETEGEPLPEYEPPQWSPTRAMGALAIRETPYASLDGNAQGYSLGRELAINPVAAYPLQTLVHEMGHIVLGHTNMATVAEYEAHRGVMEFQAESTAYLVMNDVGVPDEVWDPSGSRAYVQHWLAGKRPSDQAIRAVFKATDEILEAGLALAWQRGTHGNDQPARSPAPSTG